jgi:2-amino-4-hydroxy-6-hydroxymethyldihydropteridine diphosphokinase
MSSKKAKRPAKRTTRTRNTSSSPAAETLAYLSFGSNRGGRRARIERALREISRAAPVVAVSAFYRTDPVGFADQPFFFNAVAAVRWTGTPAGLLAVTQAAERAVGRTPSFVNGPREIDVDILDLGGRVRVAPDPVLPHPRLARRRFVLAPLSELAPEWTHPVSGRTARQLLARLPGRPRATRLSSRPRGFAAPAPASTAPRRSSAARASRR